MLIVWSNEFVEAPFEDDVVVDEEGLTNDMTLGNILTIVALILVSITSPT